MVESGSPTPQGPYCTSDTALAHDALLSPPDGERRGQGRCGHGGLGECGQVSHVLGKCGQVWHSCPWTGYGHYPICIVTPSSALLLTPLTGCAGDEHLHAADGKFLTAPHILSLPGPPQHLCSTPVTGCAGDDHLHAVQLPHIPIASYQMGHMPSSALLLTPLTGCSSDDHLSAADGRRWRRRRAGWLWRWRRRRRGYAQPCTSWVEAGCPPTPFDGLGGGAARAGRHGVPAA